MTKPPDYVIRRWSRHWQRFTPRMKETFRYIARNGKRLRRNIPGSTLSALRRHGVVMESKWGKQVDVGLNANGCDLLWWLRWTKQVTRDKP